MSAKNGPEKRRAQDDLALSSDESEKRIRFDDDAVEALDAATQATEMVKISFDVVLNESLSVFRAYNKNQPGQFTVSLYCKSEDLVDSDGKSTFSRFNAKVLNEVLNISTARYRSCFNFHGDFSRSSEFFIDVDLGFAIPVSRVEVKDGLKFGRVYSVSAGLGCLGNHNHWSYAHWQPAWSRFVPVHSLEDLATPGLIISTAVAVPKNAQTTPINVLRFEMNFYSKGTFFTDFTSHVRLHTETTKSLTFDLTIPPPVTKSPPEMERYGFYMPSFELLPKQALIRIVRSLHGINRLKALLSLSGTCRRFREILREPSLYMIIDFKIVPPAYFSADLFNFFAQRAVDGGNLRKLRLAWMPHMPEGVKISKFLRRLDPTLQHFVAEACPFVDDQVLRILSETQPNIEHLDLTRCRAISPDAFRYILSFRKLRRLSVQQTNIVERPLCELIESFSALEVLNISFLNSIEARFAKFSNRLCGPVFQSLMKAPTAPNLKALKINQVLCDTASFVTFIEQCPKMEELSFVNPDFVESLLESSIFAEIAASCPKLRRLSISELRNRNGLNEDAALNLVESCPDLEYLYVVPASVTGETVEALFEAAAKLICFVTVGRKISQSEVDGINERFPRRRFSYIDFRPTDNSLSSWEHDSEDESFNSSSENSSNDPSSDNSSGSSDESRTELERFQEETRAQVTTLVGSVKSTANTVDNIRTIFENMLEKKRMFQKRKAMHTDIRFAMATAIFNKRADVLEMLLDVCPVKDLTGVFGGDYPLLNFSIKEQNMAAIKLLLEKGAPQNPEQGMSALGTAIVTLMDLFEDENYSKSTGLFFYDVVKLLFDYKANPLFFSPEERGTNVLHYTAYLAGHAPEIADLLLERTPSSAYLSQEVFTNDLHEGPTPMASVLDMIDISDDIDVAKNIFNHALLPFLRYGALYKPDTCFSTSVMTELVALDHHFSQRVWGRPHVLAQIVIEARGHSTLDAGALTRASSPRRRRQQHVNAVVVENNDNNNNENNETERPGNAGDDSDDDMVSMVSMEEMSTDGFDGVSDDETGDLIKPFAQYIRAQFPRPLQAQCRTSILNKLPSGPSRLKAISDLDLPKMLTDFLSFQEFNLPA